jgi:hypothetical protein
VGVRFVAPALVVVALAGGVAVAQAPDEDVLRPCRRADLIGVWRVVRFGFATAARVNRADPAYQPHQRYVFNANATMSYSASEVPPTPEEHRAMLLGPAAETWALDPGGRLLRQSPGAARVDRSECRIITREVRDPKSAVPVLAGDILLTEQGDDERPLTRRLLRKLRAGE